jgi:hypothetical protein
VVERISASLLALFVGSEKFQAQGECSRDVIESKLINASNEVFADQRRIFNYKQQPTISS